MEETAFGFTKEAWLNVLGIKRDEPMTVPTLGNHPSHDPEEEFLDFIISGAKTLDNNFIAKLR